MQINFGGNPIEAKELYSTDFSSMDDFWAEGTPDVYTENNELYLKTTLERTTTDFNWVSSVFLKQPFSGNLLIEYDGFSFHEDSHRNFNFFIHTQLVDGRDMYETREERTGDYGEYHIMDNYLFTCLPSGGEEMLNPDGSTKFRIRMRRDPGFQLRKEAHSYICENFRWYNFQFLVKDGTVSICIDKMPHETYTWIDEEPLTKGLIGFRSFMSHLKFKNLKVYQV
jgi:hypothetical protein